MKATHYDQNGAVVTVVDYMEGTVTDYKDGTVVKTTRVQGVR